MPDITDFLHLSTTLRFLAPAYNKDQWSEIDSELKQQLNPIHFGLSNNVITPQEAGFQFSKTLLEFLLQKPDFILEVSKTEGYIKNKPKTLQEAKKLKVSENDSNRAMQHLMIDVNLNSQSDTIILY